MRLRATAPLVVALALAAAAAATAHGAGLRAFLLASAPDSFADLQGHSSQIGVVYPTYYECSAHGSQVLGADQPTVDAYAGAHGIVALPRYTCQDGAQVHRLLYDRSLRAKLLRQLIALGGQPAADGLCLDLENDGAADRPLLDSFVAALARALHARGRRLAVVVDGVTREEPRRSTYFYDERALGGLADEVFAMAWGVHWEGSGPGPIAPLGWVRRVARFLASLPHARRFVLGVPMYGLDWAPVGGGHPYQYASLLALAARAGASPRRDAKSGEMTFGYRQAGATHRVWYLDARAVLARLRAGVAAGLQVGVWRLGSEDQALWSALAG